MFELTSKMFASVKTIARAILLLYDFLSLQANHHFCNTALTIIEWVCLIYALG